MDFLKTKKSKDTLISLDNCSARLFSNLILALNKNKSKDLFVKARCYYGW